MTGGVASGKSALGAALVARGAALCDADGVVAQLYAADGLGARAVVALFGGEMLGADGAVDRGRLAAKVMADQVARRQLEAAVHPLVRHAVASWFAGLTRRPEVPEVGVVEAALLVETGFSRGFHRVVVVQATEAVRRRRALSRGWREGRFESIVSAQADDAARAAAADYLVPNDGRLGDLETSADGLWRCLLEDARCLAGGLPFPRR